MGIGREIQRGRKATDVVPNMAEVAANSMEEPNSLHRECVEQTIGAIESKKFDSFFSFLKMSLCPNCGNHVPRHDQTKCHQCQTTLSVPPPLRLLKCLTRLSLHFQRNFESPQSTEFDLFIRYLVSLHSKLFRRQETPTDRERRNVIETMKKLQHFQVVNGLGSIIMTDPSKITYEVDAELPEEKSSLSRKVLTDFRDTLQVVADWMAKTRTLS